MPVLALAAVMLPGQPAGNRGQRDLSEIGLEDLMNIEVTSVSKKSQRLSRVPAAIHLITQEEIRRSATTTIPELLRMAPGLQVARTDANQWAISARGFNGRWANKLLVFSGVFWDVQDVLLEVPRRGRFTAGAPGGSPAAARKRRPTKESVRGRRGSSRGGRGP